jgi:hypothetical protein
MRMRGVRMAVILEMKPGRNAAPTRPFGEDSKRCRQALATGWSGIQAAGERGYDRSPAYRFTTFHAWEYSRSDASTKIHRNVIRIVAPHWAGWLALRIMGPGGAS